MNTLAILHYHLNRGGVTRVIRNHLLALQATHRPFDRIVVIHGGRAEDWPESLQRDLQDPPVSTAVVPALDYDHLNQPGESLTVAERTLATALAAAVAGCGGGANTTTLHFHNHALGKNRALPGAVRHLAGAGFRCLLQIHDFAEDLRPDAYRYLVDALEPGRSLSVPAQLYPQAAQIHYAVLNGRDRDVLARAGVASERLHYLPNPVESPGSLPPRDASRRRLDGDLVAERPVVLYPVRGIRRKNLGEMLLWAAIYRESSSFILSLAPQNPAEQGVYQQFRDLARQLRLPIYFDTGGGGGLSWGENVAASDAMLTTSVAEGFGMVFLESWLAGRPLMGRDLPEITSDFRAAGLSFDRMSSSFVVPLDWLGVEAVLDPLREAYGRLVSAYGLASIASRRQEQELAALLGDTGVDFARLSPKLQAQVIRRVAERPSESVPDLIQRNAWLPAAGLADGLSRPQTIKANAEAAEQSFGLAAVGGRLRDVYESLRRAVPEGSVSPLAHEEVVLETFIDIRRLYPVRFA